MALNLGGIGGMKDTFKAVQEAKKMEAQMKTQRFSGSSKSGKVNVVINGLQQVIELHIEDELCNPQMKDLMVKQILEAMEDARKSFEKDMAKNMDLGQLKEMLGNMGS